MEALESRPFVGPSGNRLDYFLRRTGIDRDSLRIANCISCQPPKDWLVGAPWEHGALQHCGRSHLDPVLQEQHKVILAMGSVPTRQLLNLPKKGFILENWHGSPVQEPKGRGWVIPTFHPAYLLRGNQKLTGPVLYAFQLAKQIAEQGHVRQGASLLIDPPASEFAEWAAQYLASPDGAWLAVDIETAEKLTGTEDELEGLDDRIIRINFAYHPDEGVTVPFEGRYLEPIRQLLASPGVKCFWNERYDIPRLRAAGHPVAGTVLDFMWAWHVLQSDLPKGLGFVAPFYSSYGPWKHLNSLDPARYAAIDAVQTLRCAFGIAKQLRDSGQWEVFYRHVYELDTRVLHPAEEVGLKVDTGNLTIFQAQLEDSSHKKLAEIRGKVPAEVLPLHPKGGWTVKPKDTFVVDDVLYSQADLVTREEELLVQKCLGCGEVQVSKSHTACKKRGRVPDVQLVSEVVPRYYVQLPFNPGSPDQIISYMQHHKHSGGPGKSKKATSKPSTDQLVLERLAKTDPFYQDVLDYREIEKVEGTYVRGTWERLGRDGRLHASFLHVPSTMRLSCINPNLQNVVSDREGGESLAAGFRRVLVPADGCVLVEADFSAIEALLTGWCMGDPDFMRLSKLGIHGYLVSHKVGKPADMKWSDEDLKAYFDSFKKSHPVERDTCKRTVYLSLYGGTPQMMTKVDPKLFPSVAVAKKYQELLFAVCPTVKQWQDDMRARAHRQGYLGGSDHPWGYRHWFWDVYSYNSRTKGWSLGADAKRVVAYYPQSIAAGCLYEAVLDLTDPASQHYIGDAYHGKTPIRALVHDSVLLEVPEDKKDLVIERVASRMNQPIPELGGLRIGVAVKVGYNWAGKDKTNSLGMEEVLVA